MTASAVMHRAQPWAVLVVATLVATACVIGSRVSLTALSIAPVAPGHALAGTAFEAIQALVISVPLILFAVLGAWLTRSSGMALGTSRARMLVTGLFVGIAGIFAAAALAGTAGVLSVDWQAQPRASALAAGTMLVLLQAGGEELFFRGWLQPVLAQRWRPWLAVLVTALVFAALHLLGGSRTLVEFVNLVLGGSLFGVLALRSGGLAAPVAAHFGWNWAETVLLGLYPNPGLWPYGALVDLDLGGSPLWGGSASGLNASVATTLVLVTLIAATAALRVRSVR